MAYNPGNPTYSLAYRPDIDGLRALAVSAVILFHTFPHLLPGGFIGVDIFFVISGYLISCMLLSDLSRSQWNITRFYYRRILRIFPALLLILIFCLVFGWFLLLADEYGRLSKNVIAGIAFISNFILWSESGYFDSASDHKLLLHLWSLAIEEQFYLIWPIFLWIAWRFKQVGPFLFLACALSFLANIFNIGTDVSGTFYLPWFRFWELSMGGFLAHLHFTPKTRRAANGLSSLGVLSLFAGFLLIDPSSLFPGWWALFPTFGAVLIIAAGPLALINKFVLSHRFMVAIGLISFPMYLWHWPMLVFARIYWGQPSNARLTFFVALSILLSYLTYRFIEQPIRLNKYQVKIKVLCLLALSLLIGCAGIAIYWAGGLPHRNLASKYHRIEGDLKWSYWENKECSKLFDATPCQLSVNEPRKILIMGDSHANAIYPGLAKVVGKKGVMNIGSCPPLDGILLEVSKNREHSPGTKDLCMQRNWQILNDVDSIETVVIAMYSQPLLDGRAANERDFAYWGNLTLRSTRPEEQGHSQYQLLENGLLRTLSRIDGLNKQVIFVRDTPYIAEDFRDYCIQKNIAGAKSMECTVPRALYESQRAKEAPLIQKIRSELPNVRIFDPIDLICDQTVCYLIKDGRSLFRDHNHLSEYGSTLVGREIVRQHLNF